MDKHSFRDKMELTKFTVWIICIMINQLRQLAIFAKTIDHGSFRGAAKELNLSPSVVSHHISQLEEQLGVTLIYRSTRKLTLTHDGKRLLSATRKMLDAVEDELLDISGSAQDPSGELNITLPAVLSQSALSDAIAGFMVTYPRIKLSIDYSDVRKELIGDGYDLAVRLQTNAQNSFSTQRLFTVERRLVASSKYLESKSGFTTPQDLQNWDWLALSPVHSRGIQFQHSEQQTQKVKPNARVFSNDANALYRLVSKGLGIAVLPQFLSEQSIKDGDFEYVLPDWKLEALGAFAEWPANATKHGLIHLLVGYLSEFEY